MASRRVQPPNLRVCTRCLHQLQTKPSYNRYLSTATAITPAPPIHQIISSAPPIARFPPTQPPSHKPPQFRKSQLHRQYTSLLRSNAIILLFQHNNLLSSEWLAVRRELNFALQKTDRALSTELASAIRLQTIQVGIFESALLIVQHYNPSQHAHPAASPPHPSDPSTQTSAQIANHTPNPSDPTFMHSLSRHAHTVAAPHKRSSPFRALLSGPLAVMSFPTVSPQHIRAALSILAPKGPTFAAPLRRVNPGYYDATTQTGLQKLMFLGARVEGEVFDMEGTRWIGAIEGGMDGLRGQLVAMLQGFGAGVTGALESAGRNLWFTVEGRRAMLEEQEEGKGKEENGEGKEEDGEGKKGA